MKSIQSIWKGLRRQHEPTINQSSSDPGVKTFRTGKLWQCHMFGMYVNEVEICTLVVYMYTVDSFIFIYFIVSIFFSCRYFTSKLKTGNFSRYGIRKGFADWKLEMYRNL